MQSASEEFASRLILYYKVFAAERTKDLVCAEKLKRFIAISCISTIIFVFQEINNSSR